MKNLKFTIIVVCLNPGDKLRKTIDSILRQKYSNYEIIVKDGGSKDGSVEELVHLIHDDGYSELGTKVQIYNEPDRSIYQAMNQAISKATGDYILFLNCGDCFYSENVLSEVAKKDLPEKECIAYGDTYFKLWNSISAAPPQITGFTCYRNIPCHQSIFYSRDMFGKHEYQTQFHIRADYEHFLWSYFVQKCQFMYLGVIVAEYEGGGYSESESNRRKNLREHKEIVNKYMKWYQRALYQLLLWLTLAPVRKKIAENPKLAGKYQKIKNRMYGKH